MMTVYIDSEYSESQDKGEVKVKVLDLTFLSKSLTLTNSCIAFSLLSTVIISSVLNYSPVEEIQQAVESYSGFNKAEKCYCTWIQNCL